MTAPIEKTGSINVTPLIDILLVLLIIFMVITPLDSRGIRADLPQSAASKSAAEPEPEIVLEITHDHQFLLNGQVVARDQLAAEAAKIYRNRVNQALFIRADRELDYSEIAMAMDDLRGANQAVHFGLMGKR